MIAVTARTIPKTYASLAGSSFGAMVSPPGVRGAMPDLEGRNRERCVSYVTLRRLSKKCKVTWNWRLLGSGPGSRLPGGGGCLSYSKADGVRCPCCEEQRN